MAENKDVCSCRPGKKYMLFGVLAVVYGAINYMTTVMGWEPYMAWIAGGVILLLVSWAKNSMHDH